MTEPQTGVGIRSDSGRSQRIEAETRAIVTTEVTPFEFG
jgi:hypothetical protein